MLYISVIKSLVCSKQLWILSKQTLERLSRLDRNNTRVLKNMIFLLTQFLYDNFYPLKKKIIFFCLLTVSACVETMDPSLPKAVSMLSGDKEIIISAPKGFCVDQRLANRARGTTTLFVIDCINVSTPTGVVTTRRPLSAILTATVIDFQSDEITNILRLEEILTKKPGINFLSRANTTALLKIHQIEKKKKLLFFLVEQRISITDVKQSNYFWRVFFFIDGRIVSMTASNFSDNLIARKKLKQLISEFANNTMAANLSER